VICAGGWIIPTYEGRNRVNPGFVTETTVQSRANQRANSGNCGGASKLMGGGASKMSAKSATLEEAVASGAAAILPDDEPTCRICLEGALALPIRPLVQPCACRGSSAWAHTDCLTLWRRTSPKVKAAFQCGECNDDYRDALTLSLLEERLRQQLATHRPEAHSTMHELARCLRSQGRFDEAAPLYRLVLRVSRERLGSLHPDTLISINNLGALLQEQGDLAGAALLLREALQVISYHNPNPNPNPNPHPDRNPTPRHSCPTRRARCR
jgi:tetratricopeptide (TPR) repeat protein